MSDDPLQSALRQRIAELQAAQYERAGKIESALVAFERTQLKKSVKTVQDYIALSVHQRRLMGLSDSRVEVDWHVSPDEVRVYEERASARIKSLDTSEKTDE